MPNKRPNYGPFIKYIENHIGATPANVERVSKLGKLKTKKDKNNSDNKNNKVGGLNNNNYSDKPIMDESATYPPDPLGQKTFSKQSNTAKTKKEQDDERHADLHANVKTSNLSDKDKIFLLKREIDNLQGQLNGDTPQYTSGSSGDSVFANVPLLSAFLLFGVVLLSSRFLARKLRLMRASDSLLLDGSGEAGRNYEYSNEGLEGFELQETCSSSQQQPPQSGIFSKIASTLDRNTANSSAASTRNAGGVTYEAPSQQGASASISFV